MRNGNIERVRRALAPTGMDSRCLGWKGVVVRSYEIYDHIFLNQDDDMFLDL